MYDILFEPKLLYRKRVDNLYKNIFEKQIFLIIANIGYGKTTSIRRFLKFQKIYYIWVSFDESVEDEYLVWYKFCRAVEKFNSNIAQKMFEVGIPQNDNDLNSIVDSFEENIKEKVLFVMDDFQNSKWEWIKKIVEKFADRAIENLHIVIASDRFIKFEFEYNRCSIIEQNDIEFTFDEEIEFFKLNGFNLNEYEHNILHRYTEGWNLGVYLSIKIYHKYSNFDKIQSISDIVKRYIYDRWDIETKTAIAYMSLVSKFTYEQAVYIIGNISIANKLVELGKNNCFVKYDASCGFYRIYAVFREIAYREFDRLEVNVPNIFNNYGKWYFEHRQPLFALKCFNKSHNYEHIMSTVERYSDEFADMNSKFVLKLFNSIPDDEKLKYPMPYLIFIKFYIVNIDFAIGKEIFYRVKKFYMCNLDIEDILGEMYIIEAILNLSNFNKAMECLKCANELMDGKYSKISYRYMIFTLGTPRPIYIYYRKSRIIKNCSDIEKNVLLNYMSVVSNNDIIYRYLAMAEYMYETGDFAMAQFYSNKLKSQIDCRNFPNVNVAIYYILINIAIVNGDEDNFYEYMHSLINISKTVSNSVLNMNIDLAVGYIYSCMGKIDKVSKWIYECDLSQCNTFVSYIGYVYIVYAQSLSTSFKYHKLEIFAESILESKISDDQIFENILFNIFNAIAKYNLYGFEKSREFIIKAVDLAYENKFMMCFAENAAAVLPILYNLENEYVDKLIDICEKFKSGIKKISSSQIKLTYRENEVMNLVESGHKNSEIGQILGITPVTVEKILSSVYKKLNVNNRISAINRIKNL